MKKELEDFRKQTPEQIKSIVDMVDIKSMTTPSGERKLFHIETGLSVIVPNKNYNTKFKSGIERLDYAYWFLALKVLGY